MNIRIALAGNPNSGKTTLFNALTGSNQYVGNWPGVTVEKKEGKLKGFEDVQLVDLPGIYSLSPYTLEEVVSRNFLLEEKPEGMINIIDGSNLERNLYLTTQLIELGIPMVVAINMMDVVRKNGDRLDTKKLSAELGCPVLEISALKNEGTKLLAEAAVQAAKAGTVTVPRHRFSGCVEHAIAHIEEEVLHSQPEEKQRWSAIKLFERDEKEQKRIGLTEDQKAHIEKDIVAAEKELDDDAESIITNERYEYIAAIIKKCYNKKNKGKLSTSDKIDRVLTNRWLGLPIFALVMFVVYYVSVTTVGGMFTDCVNDGIFGDGWHLFGIGAAAYEEASDEYGEASNVIDAFTAFAEEKGTDISALTEAMDTESESFDAAQAEAALRAFASVYTEADEVTYTVEDEETLETSEETSNGTDLMAAVDVYVSYGFAEPDPTQYGPWIKGIPVLVGDLLESMNCAEWLSGLILDGIVAGLGAVLGFVPQILVLFLFLAFLEGCGYMARVAFIMDRIFRKFGLSGKSFIPLLIGTGCGVPGIMASRTIESERDRRMTVMTTTFIPCSAKIPFIGMVAGAVFGGAPWVAPSAYFIGIAAIICSGIILKKTKLFSGDPAPFVMELPAYHFPTVGSILRSMWERGSSFIKKAGTIILLSTILVWFTTYFGFVDGSFTMLNEEQMDMSILARIGSAICWIFTPLGWGNWQATVAAITGLVAKENIVGTLGILYGGADSTVWQTMGAAFTSVSGMSFLCFNLLCAPCFAAMGAIRREMNSGKWFAIAIGYQCGFAWLVGFVINQLGGAFAGAATPAGIALAALTVIGFVYLLVRKNKHGMN